MEKRRRSLFLERPEPKDADLPRGETAPPSSDKALSCASMEIIRSGKVSGITASGLAAPGRQSFFHNNISSLVGNFTSITSGITRDLKYNEVDADVLTDERLAVDPESNTDAREGEVAGETELDSAAGVLDSTSAGNDTVLALGLDGLPSYSSSSRLVVIRQCDKSNHPSNLSCFFLLLVINRASLKSTK